MREKISHPSLQSARTLMMELDAFGVDMGELGVNLHSEAAYRQLCAMCVGRARDALDLEVGRNQGRHLNSCWMQVSVRGQLRMLRTIVALSCLGAVFLSSGVRCVWIRLSDMKSCWSCTMRPKC